MVGQKFGQTAVHNVHRERNTKYDLVFGYDGFCSDSERRSTICPKMLNEFCSKMPNEFCSKMLDKICSKKSFHNIF